MYYNMVMNPINPIHRYRVQPTWLTQNLESCSHGKGPLLLCWWRGLTHYVVNTETHQYRLLTTWSHILTDAGEIPFHTSLRCKRNGAKGKLTIHYTTDTGEERILKIDEKLTIFVHH